MRRTEKRRRMNEQEMTQQEPEVVETPVEEIPAEPEVIDVAALTAAAGEHHLEIGPVGLTLSLGFASGAMLYVVFGEILPQSILMYHSKLPAFSAIIGMLVGLLIIYI